jgi:hypothetical protein
MSSSYCSRTAWHSGQRSTITFSAYLGFGFLTEAQLLPCWDLIKSAFLGLLKKQIHVHTAIIVRNQGHQSNFVQDLTWREAGRLNPNENKLFRHANEVWIHILAAT